MNISGLIPIFGGIYATLFAFGKVSISKNREMNERAHKKLGTLFKYLGPFLILCGILQLFGLTR